MLSTSQWRALVVLLTASCGVALVVLLTASCDHATSHESRSATTSQRQLPLPNEPASSVPHTPPRSTHGKSVQPLPSASARSEPDEFELMTGVSRKDAEITIRLMQERIDKPELFVELVDLPIEVDADPQGKSTLLIKTREDFVRHFKQIVPPCIRYNIMQALGPNAPHGDFSPHGNYKAHVQGVMIGRGHVWLSHSGDLHPYSRAGVKTINTGRIPGCDPKRPECC